MSSRGKFWNARLLTLALVLQCTLIAIPVQAGNGGDLQRRAAHREVPADAYQPLERALMPRSPALRISTSDFFAVQVNVDSLGDNIVGDAANEPSIAIDPVHPERMAIGWRQFNTISNNFRQAGFAFTTNGGLTWRFPGVIEAGIFRSDPVFDADAEGNFYYNSLTSYSGTYRCDVFRSSNGGATWGAGVVANGGDKQWMTIDRSESIGRGNNYSFWTSYYSYCPPGSFTRSVDNAESFEPCLSVEGSPFWGTLATGPDGELYLGGTSETGICIVKSTTAKDSAQSVVWDTVVTVNLDGDLVAFAAGASPNPGGLHGQVWTAVDRSTRATRGNVYLLASVGRVSNSDPLDVMFARSTDGGSTWSSPVRVNDDPGTAAWQWFGTMSVAPTGRIDIVWLDTRDDPGTVMSSLYYSYSTDAGVTWSANERLTDAFDPHAGWPQQNKMGDYFHMISDSLSAHLAWAATFGGEQNVYYGRITPTLTGVAKVAGASNPNFILASNYPNPANPGTTIQFTIPRASHVTLDIYNLLGEKVATLVSARLDAGTHRTRWDASGVPSGVYFYKMTADDFVQTKRLVVLK
jgi:hypothetical protein